MTRGLFSTRMLFTYPDKGPETTLKELRHYLPGMEVRVLRQIHSDRIVNADDIRGSEIPEADAIISSDRTKVLCIRTADCVPILACSLDGTYTGAIHAGWKGLSLDIVEKALDAMKSLGAKDIRVFIGPAIGPCCYQVGPDVLDRMKGIARTRNGHGAYYLDLWDAAVSQARNADIPRHMIQVTKICTSCYNELFHSYRRDGHASGRNISLIGEGAWLLPGLRVG